MGAHAEDRKNYTASIDYFAEKLRKIEGARLNIVLKSENPTADGVWFRLHHGMSFTSYGEKITVTLTRLNGGTGVHILSQCGMPTQIIDYGKNSSNVRAIFRYLEDGIKDAAPAAEAPQRTVKYCTQCGKPNELANRFCRFCGTKLV